MKVFYVSQSYHNDAEAGQYKSPYFSNREAAEKFKERVTWRCEDVPFDERRIMWEGEGEPVVCEEDIEMLDECPETIKDGTYYYCAIWT